MEKLKSTRLAFLVSNWVDAAKELFKQKSAANKAEAAAAAAAEEAAEEAAMPPPRRTAEEDRRVWRMEQHDSQ